MKRLKLFTLFFLVSFSVLSQINPFLGIYDVDSCKFETPCILVKLDTSSQNTWQIGAPQKPFFDSAFSLPNALVTDTIDPYPTGNHSYFDLKFCVYDYYYFGIIIGFKNKFQTDTLTDGGYIDVSYDNGQTWTNVLYDDTVHNVIFFNTENLYSEQDTLLGGINGFSGTSNGWLYTRIQWVWDIPVENNTPDTLVLRFHFISDSIQTFKNGWMVDDILISYADEGSATREVDKFLQKIEIVPNPFDNSATINFKTLTEGPFTLILQSSLGRIVKKVDRILENHFQLERGELKSGLYIIQIQDNTNTTIGMGKLIIK